MSAEVALALGMVIGLALSAVIIGVFRAISCRPEQPPAKAPEPPPPAEDTERLVERLVQENLRAHAQKPKKRTMWD